MHIAWQSGGFDSQQLQKEGPLIGGPSFLDHLMSRVSA
jgi:hypothetical protein